METEKTTHGKVTIYIEGGFGYSKIEAKELEYWQGKYAQYESAVHFRFRKPRQRKWRGGNQTYKPTMVVLDGWGHLNPDDPMTAPEETETGLTVRSTRFSCYDARYGEEFKAKLAAYLEANPKVKVLADFRGVNTMAPLAA